MQTSPFPPLTLRSAQLEGLQRHSPRAGANTSRYGLRCYWKRFPPCSGFALPFKKSLCYDLNLQKLKSYISGGKKKKKQKRRCGHDSGTHVLSSCRNHRGPSTRFREHLPSASSAAGPGLKIVSSSSWCPPAASTPLLFSVPTGTRGLSEALGVIGGGLPLGLAQATPGDVHPPSPAGHSHQQKPAACTEWVPPPFPKQFSSSS